MRKCDMCSQRQSAGKLTACAEACPTGATKNGNRDELIVEAQKRLADNPNQYYQRIYGLKEVGGTSVLFLSAVPFDQIGFSSAAAGQTLPGNTSRVLQIGRGHI